MAHLRAIGNWGQGGGIVAVSNAAGCQHRALLALENRGWQWLDHGKQQCCSRAAGARHATVLTGCLREHAGRHDREPWPVVPRRDFFMCVGSGMVLRASALLPGGVSQAGLTLRPVQEQEIVKTDWTSRQVHGKCLGSGIESAPAQKRSITAGTEVDVASIEGAMYHCFVEWCA